MKIEFVGGARTVTGSSYIITGEKFTLMVDCGMFQGRKELRKRNHLDLIYAPPEINALLVTHAHIDHSGLVPKLIKVGFTSSIFATSATVDLCSIMLPDSAHIQEMDSKWVNKKNKRLGLPPVDPLYSMEDAEKAIQKLVPVKYGVMTDILPGVQARFRDDGHILGSSFVELFVEENGKKTKIIFSGDVGPKNQALIRNPESPEEADFLLIESTYGDRLHKSRSDTYEEFKQIILESHNRKGNIVIPSFAVERTQEIIYTLGKLFREGAIPKITVYIDSPLAISATEIFRKNPECFDEQTRGIIMEGDSPLDFPSLKFSRTSTESKALNKEKGVIIISASGMCTAGRIKFHLQNNLYKPESSVIFVGYQAEGTLGRRLVDGAKKVRVYGKDVIVNSTIHTLGGFSGHADRDGLLDWMGNIKNDKLKVFVVHGEETASLNLASLIKKKYGYKTHVPHWGEIVDLETMKSTFTDYSSIKEMKEKPLDTEMNDIMKDFKSLVQRYKKAKKAKNIEEIDRIKSGIEELRETIELMEEEL